MNVDEDRLNIPTNYTQVRKGNKAVDSDHMLLEMNLDLKFLPTKPTRNIVYNFKSEQGRQIFKELTTSTRDFTECFTSMQPLQIQSDKWKLTLKSYCDKAFPKVRVRTRKLKRSEADRLIEKRNKMKLKQVMANTEGDNDDSLKHIEEEISEILAKEGRDKAYQFKKFSAENGSTSVSDMWILKKRLWPKKNVTIQTGKINHQGKLVTSPEDIKSLLYKEYNERLRARPEHPKMKEIFEAKKKAFESKILEAKLNKTQDWTMSQLESVLTKIGHNKAQDPYGVNRSIFHINCIGNNLKESLLILFNKIKNQGEVPAFMKTAVISTIPKKGSKFLLKNERGIFVLSAVRTLLMRLLYNTKYETINQNMSDSNVGGRKQMSCINHICVLNGFIHETLSFKLNKPVTIQIYDFIQMFDSMKLEEAISDICDSGMTDDTLSLLYESNTNINVKIKTPFGLTAENKFSKLVLQGDTWGPLMASNQVDKFGKQLLEEEPDYLYKYKGYVPLGVLGMIDDLAGVSESGVKAVQLNSFLNVKTAEKCLQFGIDKCKTLNISHKSAKSVASELYIDHWSVKHDKEGHLIEQFEGKEKIENVSDQKYLGFTIPEDGSNKKNIEAKQKRSIGIIKVIQFLVQGLGKYTLECGMIYLNFLLRSSILCAEETMYDIKESDFRQLEQIEEDLIRRLFKTGRGCPIFHIYLVLYLVF